MFKDYFWRTEKKPISDPLWEFTHVYSYVATDRGDCKSCGKIYAEGDTVHRLGVNQDGPKPVVCGDCYMDGAAA